MVQAKAGMTRRPRRRQVCSGRRRRMVRAIARLPTSAFIFSLSLPAMIVISAIAEPTVDTEAIIAHWSRGVAAI
jgi:hypothetical protein